MDISGAAELDFSSSGKKATAVRRGVMVEGVHGGAPPLPPQQPSYVTLSVSQNGKSDSRLVSVQGTVTSNGSSVVSTVGSSAAVGLSFMNGLNGVPGLPGMSPMVSVPGVPGVHGMGSMSSMNPVSAMMPLSYMENHMATQAVMVNQQRRIQELENELRAAHSEIHRLKTRQVELEKERGECSGANEETKKPTSRYWTPEEHRRFLEGLEMFGSKDIKAISNHVGTRNATQVRTHAQKYYLRLTRENPKGGLAISGSAKPEDSRGTLSASDGTGHSTGDGDTPAGVKSQAQPVCKGEMKVRLDSDVGTSAKRPRVDPSSAKPQTGKSVEESANGTRCPRGQEKSQAALPPPCGVVASGLKPEPSPMEPPTMIPDGPLLMFKRNGSLSNLSDSSKGLPRSNSIISLLSGKPTVGCLPESHSTDRLLGLLPSADFVEEKMSRAFDGSGIGFAGLGDRSMSFGQLNIIPPNFEDLDAVGLPEDTRWEAN